MSERYALVTGASTGIGHASAVALAAAGFHVFAGVRKEADAERIRSESIEPLILDVCDRGQIAAAVETVRERVGETGLHGLVNNAGIAVAGPLEFLPLEDFERQMNINVTGLVAVTQAFIPLLRQARGRIAMISSTNGFFAAPFMAPYAASKFAVEAIGDCLRVELSTWGIKVAIIEPGAIKTEIWDKATADNEAILARMDPQVHELYPKPIEAMRREGKAAESRAVDPKAVTDCVLHAMTATRPKTRYLCGGGARPQWILARWVPDRVRDAVLRKVMGA